MSEPKKGELMFPKLAAQLEKERAGVVVPRALAVNIVNNLAIQNSQYSHTLANQLQTILAAAAL